MNEPIAEIPNTDLDPSKWLDLHGNTLYAYATSFLRNRELAEEVVQETFLAALKHKDQFRGVGSEGGWLMGILKRKLIDHLRSKARQPLSLESPDTAVDSLFDKSGHWMKSAKASSNMKLDGLEAEEFREIFSMCFQGLPKAQASTFLLKEVQQESTEEVCKQLEISTTNMYVLMHRARIRLAECMKSRLAMGDS